MPGYSAFFGQIYLTLPYLSGLGGICRTEEMQMDGPHEQLRSLWSESIVFSL
jgi:hypothetical protein